MHPATILHPQCAALRHRQCGNSTSANASSASSRICSSLHRGASRCPQLHYRTSPLWYRLPLHQHTTTNWHVVRANDSYIFEVSDDDGGCDEGSIQKSGERMVQSYLSLWRQTGMKEELRAKRRHLKGMKAAKSAEELKHKKWKRLKTNPEPTWTEWHPNSANLAAEDPFFDIFIGDDPEDQIYSKDYTDPLRIVPPAADTSKTGDGWAGWGAGGQYMQPRGHAPQDWLFVDSVEGTHDARGPLAGQGFVGGYVSESQQQGYSRGYGRGTGQGGYGWQQAGGKAQGAGRQGNGWGEQGGYSDEVQQQGGYLYGEGQGQRQGQGGDTAAFEASGERWQQGEAYMHGQGQSGHMFNQRQAGYTVYQTGAAGQGYVGHSGQQQQQDNILSVQQPADWAMTAAASEEKVLAGGEGADAGMESTEGAGPEVLVASEAEFSAYQVPVPVIPKKEEWRWGERRANGEEAGGGTEGGNATGIMGVAEAGGEVPDGGKNGRRSNTSVNGKGAGMASRKGKAGAKV